jgi:hypothetical protein
MILLLTGPTGSGKTDTSWALVTASDALVFLDCDWFASRSRFSWEKLADVMSVYRALRSQIEFHDAEPRSDFVVTLTLEMAAIFQPEFLTGPENGSVHAFRLFARTDVIQDRVLSRDRIQKAREAIQAVHQLVEFDRLFPNDSTFVRIDTSDLTPSTVAKLLFARIAEDTSDLTG